MGSNDLKIWIIRLTLKNPTWKLKPQGWNSKELAGAYKDAGLCGLIRYYAKNLTSFCIIRVLFEKIKQFKDKRVYTGVARLSSTRAVRCFVNSINGCNPTADKLDSVNFLPEAKWNGITTSTRDLYKLGYSRNTILTTKRSDNVQLEQSWKVN